MPINCYRCGATALVEAPFCPQCGARLQKPTSAATVWKILGAVLLIIFALATGALGACFLLFSTMGGSETKGLFVPALFLLPLAAAAIFGSVMLLKAVK